MRSIRQGEHVCATGMIQDYRSVTEIVVKDKSQLSRRHELSSPAPQIESRMNQMDEFRGNGPSGIGREPFIAKIQLGSVVSSARRWAVLPPLQERC
jgi:hypothetical protein